GDTMLERLAERLTVDEGFSFLQSSGADLLDAVSRSARGEDIRPDWNSEVNEPGVEYARRDDGEPQYPVRESEAPRDATPAAGTYSRRDGSSFRQEGADVRGRINVDRASGRPGRSGGYDDGRGSGALPVEVLALSTEVRESLNFRTRQGEAMGVPHPLEAAASREHFVDAVVRDRRISSIFRALVAKEVSAASLVGLKIDGPRDFAVAAAAFRNPLFERVGVAILDKERRVVRAEITGVGNVISSNVGSERIKQILEENQGAAGFMIWHNHPSGNPDPSDQDFRATRGFEQMGESLGVPFLDHIITNGDKFYSFDEGRIGSMETTRPSWEVAKRGALKSFTERELLIDFARSVRAKDSTGTLVFLVNVRKDVVGVEIVTSADDIPALSRQIGRSALREGATSVMLDGAVATMRERVQILEKSLAEDYGVHLDDASHVAGGGFQTLRESYSYLPQYGEISLNSRRKVAAERELAAGNDEVSESKRARKSDAEKLAYRKERLANAEQAFADAKREVSAWYKDKEAGFDSDREELQDSMARQRAAERELRNARLTLEQFEANTGKASATPSPKDGDRKDAARDTEADTFPLAESERDIAARRLGTAQTELTKLQEMGKKIGGESYKNAPVYKQALAERDAAFAAVTELSKSAPAAKADRLAEMSAEMSAEREKLFRELNEGQPSPEEAATKQARLAELNREIKAAERAGAKSKTPADWNPEKFDASTWAMRLAGDDITSIPGREHFSQLGENRIGELETELKSLRDKANAPRIDTILANLRQLQRDRRTRGAPAQVSSPSREEVVEARAAAEDISAERMAKAERRLKRREDMSAGDNAELLADLRPREVDVDGEDFVATDAFALVDSGATLEAMEPSAEDMQALRELDSVVDAATPKARALDREAAAESSAQSERAGNLAEIDREGGGSPPGQKPSDGTGEFPDRGDAGPVRQVGAQTTDTKQSNGFFGPLLEFAKGFSGVVPEIPRGAMHLKGIVNGYKSLIRGQEVSVHQATEEVRKILAPIISLKTPVDAAMRKAAFEARRKQNASQAKLTAATQSGDAGGVAKYAAEVKARSAEVDALLESAKDQPLVIFENFILWRDLMHRAATLKRDDGSPITLPFGVNPAEVRRQAKVWSDRVKASPDSAAIRESIRLHEQSVLATWEDFKSRTLPVDGVWNGGRAYYPHIIPEKASGRPDRVRRSATADFRAYLTNPVGWTKAIETDYAKAMFLHLAAVRADNLHQDVVRRDFASLDETESMEAERKALRAAGKDVPGIEAMARQRGLVPFDAGDAMRYALVPTVDRYALSKALGRILDDGPLAPQLEALQKQGISIPATAFKEALAVAEKKPWFVPPEAAEALSAIEKQEQPGKNEELKRAAEYVNRYWKKYTLFFPHNYIRYEFNNTVADTGKLAAVDPGAFRQIRPAFKEVRAFFRGEPVSAETAAAFRLGVFDTPTVKEVEDLADIPEFSEKLRTDGERLMSNIKGWAGRDWNKFSKYREATYRLAKYNADLERLRKGETPVYGGAYWKDIETIQESEKGAGDRNERRAAAISLATMNDSASVSRSGAQLRRYLIPFYSFTENNLRYHLNLFRNLRDMTARGDMTRTEATTLGAKATASLTARAAVGIASRAVFPMLALAIYNAQVGGEDELSEEDRRRLHVNLGKDDQGRRRVLYLENDFAQVLRWFGGNRAMGNVIEVMSGRQTLETASKDWADNLIPDVLNTALSVGPLVRAGVIAGTGREIGMDVTSPRTVHGSDKTWALVKEAVGIVPADMLRSAFDKDYVSGRDAGDWLKQIVLQIRKRDPESWAYYKIRDDAEAFLEERKGVSTDRGARSSPDQIALRSFRRAIFKGNIDDALGLYDRLLKYGYTAQRLQSSLRSMDPLSSLGKEDGSRRAFVEQLDEQGRKDLDRARLYAERYQVLQGKERILFPREIKGNPAAQERLMERFKDDPRKREILQSLLEEQANQSAAERQLDAALAARRSMKGAR
ncbi:MAG: repair protein RadC, partial [Verrucomicrobiota bacterium]